MISPASGEESTDKEKAGEEEWEANGGDGDGGRRPSLLFQSLDHHMNLHNLPTAVHPK